MTTGQLSLIDMPADPMHRTDGAETSRVAALTVATNVREEEVREALRWLVCASTSHDVAAVLAEHGMVRPSNTIARRLTSLERKGLVRRCGTKTGPYGQPCFLWRLTP